ncbi:MAG: AAA family ATPase [Leptospiraceae bacterium]|nr:AAA family ATPase [Leptospiraceae bacterium]
MLKKLVNKDTEVLLKEQDFRITSKKKSSASEYFLFQSNAINQLRTALDNPLFYPNFILTGTEGTGKRSGILSLLNKEYSQKRPHKQFYYSRRNGTVLSNPKNLEGLSPLFDPEIKEAPIIYDPTPSTMSLVGIPTEKKYHPGNLVKSCGGFLILPIFRLVTDSNAYDVLKSCLLNHSIDFINLPELSFFQDLDRTLPKFPLDTRVILIGEEYYFEQLIKKDPGIGDIFKLKIDLEFEAELNKTNLHKFSILLDSLTVSEYPSINSSGKKRMMEEALLLNDSKSKFTLNISDLKSIYEEAMVKFKNKKSLGYDEIDKAIEIINHRFSMPKRKYHEDLKNGIYNLSLSGHRLGRINALSILTPFSTYQEFGQVNVISSRALMGSGNFINIEREVNLSGDVHDKGVFILQSFLKGLFANFPTLGVDISILFEQSHSLVDGDSATVAELLATLSALSEILIPCNIAITGSMSQYGEVMPVGAINQKIGAWSEIIEILGNKKDIYKVYIPDSNRKDIILPRDARKLVQSSRMEILAYSHVSEVVSDIMGVPFGKIEKDGKYSLNSVLRNIEDKLEKREKVSSG